MLAIRGLPITSRAGSPAGSAERLAPSLQLLQRFDEAEPADERLLQPLLGAKPPAYRLAVELQLELQTQRVRPRRRRLWSSIDPTVRICPGHGVGELPDFGPRRSVVGCLGEADGGRLTASARRVSRGRNARTHRRGGAAAPSVRRPSNRLVGGDIAGREIRAGPSECTVDRCDGGAMELGDLGRLPPQNVAQDQHRALARREAQQCRHEGADEPPRGRRPARRGRHMQTGPGRRGRARASVCPAARPGRTGRPLATMRDPSGRARRCFARTMSRHTLVAIR